MDPLYTASSTVYLHSLFCLHTDLLIATPAERVDDGWGIQSLFFFFYLFSVPNWGFSTYNNYFPHPPKRDVDYLARHRAQLSPRSSAFAWSSHCFLSGFCLFVLIEHSWSIRDLSISFSAWKRPAMYLMDQGYYRIFSMIYMHSAACLQSPHFSLIQRLALVIFHLLWRHFGCCLAHIIVFHTQFSKILL